jgi:hypothetical protein
VQTRAEAAGDEPLAQAVLEVLEVQAVQTNHVGQAHQAGQPVQMTLSNQLGQVGQAAQVWTGRAVHGALPNQKDHADQAGQLDQAIQMTLSGQQGQVSQLGQMAPVAPVGGEEEVRVQVSAAWGEVWVEAWVSHTHYFPTQVSMQSHPPRHPARMVVVDVRNPNELLDIRSRPKARNFSTPWQQRRKSCNKFVC